MMGSSGKVLLVTLLTIWVASGAAIAATAADAATITQTIDQNTADQIERITNEALHKQIDFERWYWSYKAVATREPRWRHLRWFAMQDAAAALFLASQIGTLDQAARGMIDPEKVNTPALRRATVTGLLGSILEGGSSAAELGSNTLIAIKNWRRGTHPAVARRTALERLKTIDALLAEREALVAQMKGTTDFGVYDSESKLLKLCRDSCLLEFADIYGDVKSYQASNNIYYALDVAGSSIYVASYVLGLKGLKNEKYNEGSLITGVVADSIYVPAAQVYSYSYKYLYNHAYNRFLKQVNQPYYDARGKESDALKQLEIAAAGGAAAGASADTTKISAQLDDRISNRLAIYRLWTKRYKNFANNKEFDQKRLDRVARQSNLSGPLISGAFLASDIIGLNSFYRMKDNARATNANAFGATIATTAASAANLGLTTFWYGGDLIHSRRLSKRHAKPEQVVQDRLRTVDELDAIMGTKRDP